MHCRRARTAWIEYELGLLGSAASTELGRHLGDCDACAAAVRAEDRFPVGAHGEGVLDLLVRQLQRVHVPGVGIQHPDHPVAVPVDGHN